MRYCGVDISAKPGNQQKLKGLAARLSNRRR